MGAQRYGISSLILNSISQEFTVLRCQVQHEKRNSLSPSNHEFFCLLYEHLTNKKKQT